MLGEVMVTCPGPQLSLSDAAGREEVRGHVPQGAMCWSRSLFSRALTPEDALTGIGFCSSVIAACSCPEFPVACQPVPLRSGSSINSNTVTRLPLALPQEFDCDAASCTDPGASAGVLPTASTERLLRPQGIFLFAFSLCRLPKRSTL